LTILRRLYFSMYPDSKKDPSTDAGPRDQNKNHNQAAYNLPVRSGSSPAATISFEIQV